MIKMSKFNEHDFEQKLFKLKDSHDSIASLSSWCLTNVENHSKIVAIWLGALRKVKMDHRILLFYLANDIIQYSKKKSLPYVSAFAPALQKATTMVRDPAIRNKILRIFKIWDERNIYDEQYLVDLSRLLTRGHKTANRIDLEDFQPNLLYSRLKSCQSLEEDTDSKMKCLIENPMPLTDTERLRTSLKNRKASEDVILEIDEGIKKITAFITSLEAEIKERTGLIDLLEISEQYYEKEFSEATIVSNAYKCFTNRVKTVKKKLDDKIEILPSPVPTPSPTAPSPEPEPLDDSDERATFEFTPASGGGTSFMDGSLFSGQSLPPEFESYYANRAEQTVAYSPTSAYNGADSFTETTPISTETQPLKPLVMPDNLMLSIHPLVPPPPPPPPPPVAVPPINVPPVFNYFRPISTDTTPPPPPPLPPKELVPALDQSTTSQYDSSFYESAVISDCSSEGLKIEVISSPNKDHQTSLSTLLESMVAADNSSIPPPPVPPTIDFVGWNDNSEYWESPASPPMFEKEGLPQPSLADVGLIGGPDVDMRTKDVDHRNLISLTGGGAEQDWDFPPSTDMPEVNEDMEMSDEDLEKIDDEAVKSNTNYSNTFPILPIKPDVTTKGRNDANNVDSSKPPLVSGTLAHHGDSSAEPVLQTITSIDTPRAITPERRLDNLSATPGNSTPYQLLPPPPPPSTYQSPSVNNDNSRKMWRNPFPPPPPAPPGMPNFGGALRPQFDDASFSQFQTPPRAKFENTLNSQLNDSQRPPNQPMPVPTNFQNQGTPQQMRFDRPTTPIGFEPTLPPPFPATPGSTNFNRFPAGQSPSPILPQPPPMPQDPMNPQASFDRTSLAPVGQPIPSFEAQGAVNQFEHGSPQRPPRVPFFGGFRPRFEPRNFPRGSPFYRGNQRFQGHPFRPHRARFPRF